MTAKSNEEDDHHAPERPFDISVEDHEPKEDSMRKTANVPEGSPEDIVMEMFLEYLHRDSLEEVVRDLRTLGHRRPHLLRRYVDALEALVADPPTERWTLLYLAEHGANACLDYDSDSDTDAQALVWIRDFADTYVRPLTRDLEREGRLPPRDDSDPDVYPKIR